MSVVVVTKDRPDDALVAARSVLRQANCRPELIVVDDGSTIDVAESLHSALPAATIYRSEASCGYVFQRNFAASVARAPIIVSLDDDARLAEPDILAVTLADFAAGCDIGAVAMPYTEPRPDGSWVVLQTASAIDIACVDAYVGTAHAVRRSLFLELGGYRAEIVHQGEERDYCVRMLDRGYLVRLGSAAPLEHRPSPRRSTQRMAFYGRRNDVLFAWQNVPARSLPWHLLRATVGGLLLARRLDDGQLARPMLDGMRAGVRDSFKLPRKPVRMSTYCLSLRLRRRGPVPLAEARAALRGGTSGRTTRTHQT